MPPTPDTFLCCLCSSGQDGGEAAHVRSSGSARLSDAAPLHPEDEVEEQQSAIQALVNEARSYFRGGFIVPASDFFTVHVP
jgi:hypothetical protein